MTRIAPVVFFLVAALASSASPEPESPKRTIGEQPAYTSAQPYYALLVLGAAKETRVWFVVDGETLYADRNADGDLVDPGEKVGCGVPQGELSPLITRQASWTVPSLEASKRYTDIHVRFGLLKKDWTPAADASNRRKVRAFMQSAADVPHAQLSHIQVNIEGVGKQWTLNTTFGTTPEAAPVFHMDAPLTLGIVESFVPFDFWKDSEEQTLSIAVGNPGIGPGSFAFVFYDRFPDSLRPTVEITFPGKKGEGPFPMRLLEVLVRQRYIFSRKGPIHKGISATRGALPVAGGRHGRSSSGVAARRTRAVRLGV